jgi:glutathione S-transferase
MPLLPRFRLWHSLDARSFRVLWTFEELALRRGRDYALHTMRFPPRQHHPEFIERNPLGTVPWFEHTEPGELRPRASMSESCAVALYLAELHSSPLALRSGDDEYGGFLNWLHHAETLTFPQAVVMRYALFERERGLRAAAEDYARWFHARLRLLNTALADGRTFLVGASVENKQAQTSVQLALPRLALSARPCQRFLSTQA